MIACVRIPHFFAEIERRAYGQLPSTPLIVYHGTQVVAACNVAEAEGVQPGMSLRHAQLCYPHAHAIAATPGRYREAAADLIALLATFSDRVECDAATIQLMSLQKVSPSSAGTGQWFLDLGRVNGGASTEMVAFIQQRVHEQYQFMPAVAVASTRFTARCAAVTLLSGDSTYIPPGQEHRFLAPLPIAHLPLDAENAARLEHLGLRTLGQIAALPTSAIESQFGPVGRLLHVLARGKDVDPIPPYLPPRSIELAQRFDGTVGDRRMLHLALQQLSARLATRLQRRGSAAQSVGLRIELEDVSPWADSIRLDTPTSQPELLCRALGQLLARASIVSGVEALGASCSSLTQVVASQHDLFGQETVPGQRRRDVLGSLVTKFGARRFFRAVPQQQSASLPEQRFCFQELPLL